MIESSVPRSGCGIEKRWGSAYIHVSSEHPEGASRVSQVPHLKLCILSVNELTLCIAIRTGRLWAAVWQSSRIHLTRAVQLEWGGYFGEHVDQDSPSKRACVR
jgi:hypothetical protein